MKLNEYEKLMSEACDRLAAAQDEIKRIRAAAKNVCDHWAEFGPVYGFDETVEDLYRALALSPSDLGTP